MDQASPNKTSGRYLIEMLERRNAGQDADTQRKYELAFDVYIKQRSYAILNKVFFWTALFTTACVALWPLVVVILLTIPSLAKNIQLVGATVVQTMITGFAAFNAYIYSHYKTRQVSAENLLRLIAFTNMPVERLAATVVDEMSRLDQGFSFRVKTSEADKERP